MAVSRMDAHKNMLEKPDLQDEKIIVCPENNYYRQMQVAKIVNNRLNI